MRFQFDTPIWVGKIHEDGIKAVVNKVILKFNQLEIDEKVFKEADLQRIGSKMLSIIEKIVFFQPVYTQTKSDEEKKAQDKAYQQKIFSDNLLIRLKISAINNCYYETKFAMMREQEKRQKAAEMYNAQYKKEKSHKRLLREIERQLYEKALAQEKEHEFLREKNRKTEKELHDLHKKHIQVMRKLKVLSDEIKALQKALVAIRENYARRMASVADRVEINGVAAFNPSDNYETINAALKIRTRIAIAMEQLKQEKQNAITGTAGSTRMLHGLGIARAQATHSREYDEKLAALQEKFQHEKVDWVKQFCPEIHWKGKSQEACAAFFDQVFEHELFKPILKKYDKETESTVEEIAEKNNTHAVLVSTAKIIAQDIRANEGTLSSGMIEFEQKETHYEEKTAVLKEAATLEIQEEKIIATQETGVAEKEIGVAEKETGIVEKKTEALVKSVIVEDKDTAGDAALSYLDGAFKTLIEEFSRAAELNFDDLEQLDLGDLDQNIKPPSM